MDAETQKYISMAGTSDQMIRNLNHAIHTYADAVDDTGLSSFAEMSDMTLDSDDRLTVMKAQTKVVMEAGELLHRLAMDEEDA